MGIINGKKVLQVVRTVETGGGATLNLAYGLTPPSDTTKIWVKSENEPSKESITNENRSIVGNQIKSDGTIVSGIYATTTGTTSCKLGNYIYIGRAKGIASYEKFIHRYNITTGQIDAIITGASNSYKYYVLGKKDNHTFYYIEYNGSIYQLYEYDVDTQTSTLIDGFPTNWLNNNVQMDGDYIYGTSATSSSFTSISVYRWNIKTKVQENFNFSMGTTKTSYNNVLIKNNKLYYTLSTSIADANYNYNSTTYVYEIDFETGVSRQLDKTFSREFTYGNVWVSVCPNYGYLAIIEGVPFIYGGYSVFNHVAQYDRCGAFNYYYYNAVGCIDYEEDKVYLIGGQTNNSQEWTSTSSPSNRLAYDTFKSNWELEENNLLISSYSNGIDLPIISTESVVVRQNIQNCWLGDNNNIAQAVDMFYYDNSLWKGINCLGYTQLKECVISANNVSIDLASATSDTQTITITPTWAYETGVITISVVTSDDTKANASLSGDSLTINALDVGTPTITISVVDEYGTTFTKTITITITNSGA